MRGGGDNHSYEQVFKKYNKDLSSFYAQSAELVDMLEPIIEKLRSKNQKIEILSDVASFEYKKLGLQSKNIHQMFGVITPDRLSKKEFLEKSHSKNLAFFVPINVIIFSKNGYFFDKNQPLAQDLKKSLQTIEDLNQGKYGFKKISESKDFIIYAKIKE